MRGAFPSRAASVGLLLALVFSQTVRAQDREPQTWKGVLRVPEQAEMQILTTADGSSFVGRITQITEEEVIFNTVVGDMRIAVSMIREIQDIPTFSIKEGAYWFPNPNATRLFFAPTAHMLKQGEGTSPTSTSSFPELHLACPMR